MRSIETFAMVRDYGLAYEVSPSTSVKKKIRLTQVGVACCALLLGHLFSARMMVSGKNC